MHHVVIQFQKIAGVAPISYQLFCPLLCDLLGGYTTANRCAQIQNVNDRQIEASRCCDLSQNYFEIIDLNLAELAQISANDSYECGEY